MKPAPLRPRTGPRSVDDAVEPLAAGDGDAQGPRRRPEPGPAARDAPRPARPSLVDLGGLPDLAYIRDDGGIVEIGAMTRHPRRRDLAAGRRGRARCCPPRCATPATSRSATAARSAAVPRTPTRPAEIPAVARALDARARRRRTAGSGPSPPRTSSRASWSAHSTPTRSSPPSGSLGSPPGTVVAVEEFARRHGDFALAGGPRHAPARRRRHRRRSARPGRSSGRTRPRLAAEQTLIGQAPSAELVRAAADAAVASTDPGDDIHASADYRRTLARC